MTVVERFDEEGDDDKVSALVEAEEEGNQISRSEWASTYFVVQMSSVS